MNAMTRRGARAAADRPGRGVLFYPGLPINVAFLRGTTADPDGNVTMEREAAIIEVAVHRPGHEELRRDRAGPGGAGHHRALLTPREVRIPGILVDGVVVARPQNHAQTFAEVYNPAYTGEIRTPLDRAGARRTRAR